MHQLAFARFSALVLALTVIGGGEVRGAPTGVVSVLYAGSLVTPMEGPVKAALQLRGIDFQGEPGGSQALANLIAGGLRTPDAFIYVDPHLVTAFRTRVRSATAFASTNLGIAWSPHSRYAALFEGVVNGTVSLQHALEAPGLRIGRTDPNVDPKGRYTIAAMTAWLGPASERRLLGIDEEPSQIFPEQDLLARVDTGQADVGFFYRTEAVSRGYPFVRLPDPSGRGGGIVYTLAILKNAPHPHEAQAFADFILTGPGRAILERAGLDYLSPAK